MTMADIVNHPPHYTAGGIECIDALEAATIELHGIEAVCTANAIKYLWRWKMKNGTEDLKKAIWYINRIIERAGAAPKSRKELFNMTENKHGFTPKTEFTMGGIAWTIIQTGESWVKCIASKCVEERVFDEENKNDFAASSLRAYLNGEFLQRLIDAGAPEAMFEEFAVDLTADDGLKQYGTDSARIGLARSLSRAHYDRNRRCGNLRNARQDGEGDFGRAYRGSRRSDPLRRRRRGRSC